MTDAVFFFSKGISNMADMLRRPTLLGWGLLLKEGICSYCSKSCPLDYLRFPYTRTKTEIKVFLRKNGEKKTSVVHGPIHLKSTGRIPRCAEITGHIHSLSGHMTYVCLF